jgi:hypothetical protein
VRSALAYIRTGLPHVELHLYGASSAERVEDLAAFDQVVLYSARPAALARTRQILDEGLRPRPGREDPAVTTSSNQAGCSPTGSSTMP